ncbi:hypothetical protein WSM22_20690 [Cytophagales bacterium WSM2-2]|nr:hypothetical protein WSM22_20690 [Cytophagales bacterium WSM2-2]
MLKRYALVATLLLIFAAGIAYFEIQFQPTVLIYFTLAWVAVVVLLIWIGNRLITKLLNRYLSWLAFGNIRFFVHLFCGIVYSLLVINGTYAVLKYSLTEDPPSTSQLIVMNAYGAILFIPIFSIYFSLHFLHSWRKSEVESEKFQKESVRSQLEQLKSHLDPHFLFNNLNILASLITVDPKKSAAFLDKFAEVYRLLLRSKTEDLISLREELDFVESYCFLLQTRFEESIQFTIDIPASLHQLLMPPLTLQMLIENAIKHTAITEKKPLHVKIFSAREKTLTVSNNLNERLSPDGNHSGSGLENIRMRYGYFTSETIDVVKTMDDFSVTIPLLETA